MELAITSLMCLMSLSELTLSGSITKIFILQSFLPQPIPASHPPTPAYIRCEHSSLEVQGNKKQITITMSENQERK